MSTVSVDRSQRRQYACDGKRYFSVTQICHAMMGETSYGSEADMQRGTDLHTIFALAVASYAGRCAPPIVPGEYQGYYQSMQDWIDAFKPVPISIEKPSIYCKANHSFAGTPDLLAWIQHKQKRRLAIVDLKSGAAAPWHRIQVSAYARLDGYTEAETLGLLYVHADGNQPTYQAIARHGGSRDMAASYSALQLLIWREL